MPLLYYDLLSRKVGKDENMTSFRWPQFIAGGLVSYSIRFVEYDGSRSILSPQPIAALRTILGFRDRQPETGEYRLTLNPSAPSSSNTTVWIDLEADPVDVSAALNSVVASPGDFVCEQLPNSLLIRRENGETFHLGVSGNRLIPSSFVRIRDFPPIPNSKEVSFVQSPLAFSDDSFIVLPEAPRVTRLQEGWTDTSGVVYVNEVQSLRIPPEFLGAFVLRRNTRRSEVLSKTSTLEEIQKAVNKLLEPEGGRAVVTNPLPNTAYIEFVGDLKGLPQPLLEVLVVDAPEGDWTFRLPLNSHSLFAAFGDRDVIDVPFEIEVDIYNNPNNHSAGVRTVKLVSDIVQVVRPVAWEGMAQNITIDWVRPPEPKNYIPFTTNQLLVGNVSGYSNVIGNGTATSFAINHNLNSDNVIVTLRENTTPGQVIPQNLYSIQIESSNDITITLSSQYISTYGIPGNAGLVVLVSTVGPASAFTNHTHTIAQVETLSAVLDTLGGRIAVLESLLPRPGAAGVGVTQPVKHFIPPIGEVLPDTETLGVSITLASQVQTVEQNREIITKPVRGTVLEELERSKEVTEKATQRDPDTAGPGETLRFRIPGIGIPGDKGTPAEKGPDGKILTPEIPPTPANPVVWPEKRVGGGFPVLLRAISGTPTDVSSLPSSPGVYRNSSSSPISLPGGNGRRAQTAQPQDIFAWDGLNWYLVTSGVGGLFHPIEMERELWRVFLTPTIFPENSQLLCRFELRFRLVGDFFNRLESRRPGYVNISGMYILRLEALPVSGFLSLDTPGQIVTLGYVPLPVTPTLTIVPVRVTARRNNGSAQSTVTVFGQAMTSELPPFDTGGWALRARLTDWDVDDGTPSPRGQVSFLMPETTLSITPI